MPSILLQTLAQPFFPSIRVDPPSLPEKIYIATALIPPPRLVSLKHTIEPSHRGGAKYGYFGLDSPSKSNSVGSSTEYGSLEIYFEGGELSQELVYAELRAGVQKDLTRPQPMYHLLSTKNRDPPMSILYEAFAMRMEGQEDSGEVN